MSYLRTGGRVAMAALILTTLLAIPGTETSAGAHPGISKWWQYDKAAWSKGWKDDPRLHRQHTRWHHQHTSMYEASHDREHRQLGREHLAMHFHRAVSFDSGQATWYDGRGRRGACGKPLVGLYAASRTLPCGSLVSVRAGGHYVLVRILDRGPFGSSSRILDLSPRAFKWLSPLGAGVIWVKAVRLRR